MTSHQLDTDIYVGNALLLQFALHSDLLQAHYNKPDSFLAKIFIVQIYYNFCKHSTNWKINL